MPSGAVLFGQQSVIVGMLYETELIASIINRVRKSYPDEMLFYPMLSQELTQSRLCETHGAPIRYLGSVAQWLPQKEEQIAPMLLHAHNVMLLEGKDVMELFSKGLLLSYPQDKWVLGTETFLEILPGILTALLREKQQQKQMGISYLRSGHHVLPYQPAKPKSHSTWVNEFHYGERR